MSLCYLGLQSQAYPSLCIQASHQHELSLTSYRMNGYLKDRDNIYKVKHVKASGEMN